MAETWREWVEKCASEYNLQIECLEEFDADIKAGVDPERAAFGALWEWDCVPVPLPEPPKEQETS
jgi:hypothetical protein